MPDRTLYEMLMLHPSATEDVVNAAFRALAKRYHPDRDASAAAAERMKEINLARSVLTNAEARRDYDARLQAQERQATRTRPIPTMPTDDASPRRTDVPGAINMKYEDGGWRVRPKGEQDSYDPPYGEAGPPPTFPRPSGSVLGFGRYKGWSIDQIAAHDRDYLEWLARTMAGRTYAAELEAVLARTPVQG